MRSHKRIEPHTATVLGSDLKHARERRKLTLIDVANETGVHYGQLSRFESGNFKIASANLQKVSKYLHVRLPTLDDDLSIRFERLTKRSPRHLAACVLLVEALEKFD